MAEESLPSAFLHRMQRQLPQQWEDFIAAHRGPAPTSIRINPMKGSPRDLEKVPWTEFGYYLEQRPSFTFDPLFHGGAYYVQEASSMFLEQAIKQTTDLHQPLQVLDLCAAPGGKSTHLLSLIHKDSLLVANETIRSRATILAENIQKWGSHNVVVTNNDPGDFHPLEGFFDVIVVDAPCSGEGLFRKDAGATKEWTEDSVALCAARQRRILDQVWPSLKTNGVLIYCTCTYNETENEDNIGWLMEEKKAECLRLKADSSWHIHEAHVSDVWGYRFFPHQTKGEGFFLAVVKKNNEQHEVMMHKKKTFDHPPGKIKERLAAWIKKPDEIEFIKHDELILAIAKNYIFEIEFLSKFLRVIQKGTAIATAKHDKLIPEHAFALSTNLNRPNFNAVDLSMDQAIAFLRKDNLHITSEKNGFALVTFHDVALGWVNLLGNRTNNLYPSAWRIRS